MVKTKQQLDAELDSVVTTNGDNEITGALLNGVLKSMAGSTGSYFLYPKDVSVTSGDIGKLMMNDGSGTAKVYQLDAAATARTGRWIIKMDDEAWGEVIGEAGGSWTLKIAVGEESNDVGTYDWRNGTTPTNALEELEAMRDFINTDSRFDNVTAAIVSGELVLTEDTYENTEISTEYYPPFILVTDILSRPALLAAPTALPLGKLVGIDGTNAIISSNNVEVFSLEGTLTVDHGLFNNENNVVFNEANDINNLFKTVVVPAADGKAKAFDLSEYDTDSTFLSSFRHQVLGIAILSTSNTVTVMNFPGFSTILSIALKFWQKRVFPRDDD